jgi:hypothetical protein
MTTNCTESVTNSVSFREEGEIKVRLNLKTVWFCFVLVMFLFCSVTYAQPERVVNVLNKDKETVFQLDFYEGFSSEQIGAITEAAQYWVDILKSHGTMPFALDENGNKVLVLDQNNNPVVDTSGQQLYQRQPVVFSILFDGALAGNANAMSNGSVVSNIDQYNLDLSQALLTDGVYAPLVNGGHATINVGSGWNVAVGNQSQSGRVAQDLTPILIHEMGHALGIATSVTVIEEDIDPITQEIKWKFPQIMSRYDSRLRDNNGNSANVQPGSSGKEVGYDNTVNHSQSSTIFDLGDPESKFSIEEGFGNPSHPTFVGKNTLELWYGKPVEKLTEFEKNSGVPLQGYVYMENEYQFPNNLEWYYDPSGTLSHINTTNSLMSWQAYRNYPGFIEIELAVMQDIGYSVERSDFFGKSFYVNGDGTPFYNSATFGYWDSASQSYDMSRPNISSYALGAHLFAKDLNVIQTGSIWANGPGSAGIRIDGSNNKLTLARGTSVYADGTNGVGILAAYGKDHSIILQNSSSVHATGNGGIGISFNFGEPCVGDKRGSYYYGVLTDEVGIPISSNTEEAAATSGYLPELYGSLVKSLDISGSVTGSRSQEIVRIRPWWSGGALSENLTGNVPEVDTEPAEVDAEPAEDNSMFNRSFAFGAAVYIDGTAAVDKINILNGAEINGDILSFRRNSPTQILYPPESITNELGKLSGSVEDVFLIQYNALKLQTEITFGYKADANGAATDTVDNDFNFTLKDNINYFRYEVIPHILYLDPENILISPQTANSNPKLKAALEQMRITIDSRGDIIDIPVGYAQGTGFYPTEPGIIEEPEETEEIEEIEEIEENRRTGVQKSGEVGYWVSPSYNLASANEASWHSIIWGDGFVDYQFADGNISATIVKPGDGKVYADIVTPGAETTSIHLAGGTTEFLANSVYALNMTIDRDATLLLTPGVPKAVNSTIKVRVVDNNGNPFLDASGNPLVDDNGQPFEIDCILSPVENSVVKIPEINISAMFNPQTLSITNQNTSEETANSDALGSGTLGTTIVFPTPHPTPPTMDNFGRIAGEGVFRLGQRRFSSDGNMQVLYGLSGKESYYWEGTLNNEGVLSPGAKNGEDIGIINVVGDLTFGKNSVYEVTVGGSTLVERYTSAITQDGKYIDEKGNIYDPTIGQVRGVNRDPNSTLTESTNSNSNVPPESLPIYHDPIYGTENDLLVVLNNTKMDGTLKVTFLPDKVFGNETTTHTIIQSGTFTSGSNFKQIDYETGFLYVSDVFINPYNSHEAQFAVVRDLNYFKDRAKTFNEKSVATAIDASLFERPDIAFSLGDASNSVADLRDMYRQIGASARANSALINLWNPSELLFNRIGYGNGSMSTGNRGRVDWNRLSGRTNRVLGQTPVLRRTGSLWGDFTQTYFNAESDGNSDNYNISRSGVMVGGEWNLTPYSAIGAIAAYNNSTLKQTGDKLKSDDYILGTYFVCAPFNEFEFKSYIGLGFQEYDMDRHVRNENIVYNSITGAKGIFERYHSNTKGNTFNLSFELARPLMLHPTFILRPTLGFDLQSLWQNAFTEQDYSAISDTYGNSRYGLRYNRMNFNRSILRIGFSSETSGSRGGIRMRAFYNTNLGNKNVPISEVAFVGTGNVFRIHGVDLGKNFLSLGVGANYWLDGEKTSSLFLDYDANIYNTKQKVDAHTFSIGFLQNF